MCSEEKIFRNNKEYRVYLDTISRYVIFQKTKDGAQPRNFLKNRTIWHYLGNIPTNILRWYFMLNC